MLCSSPQCYTPENQAEDAPAPDGLLPRPRQDLLSQPKNNIYIEDKFSLAAYTHPDRRLASLDMKAYLGPLNFAVTDAKGQTFTSFYISSPTYLSLIFAHLS